MNTQYFFVFFVVLHIVRNRGVSDFRGGTKGREFREILGGRVGVSIFEPGKEKNWYK
jgi:hypothetical protein